MAEFEEKLGAILNDPQAMQQIMALAQSLGGNSAQNGPNPSLSATSAPPEQDVQEAVFEPVTFDETEETGENQALSGLNLDPKLLSAGMKALSAYQDPNNEKALLLQALRPFVKEERYKKVDKAVQIVKMSKAIRVAIDGFKGGEQGV